MGPLPPTIVSLSLISFGDADGFDAWRDEPVADATSVQPLPTVAFNAIVMSMVDNTPAETSSATIQHDVEPLPRLAA